MGTMEGHTRLAVVRPDVLTAWSYQSDIPGRLSRYQQTGDLRRRPRPLLEPPTDIVGPRVYGARMTGESVDPQQPQAVGALRYAVNEDATSGRLSRAVSESPKRRAVLSRRTSQPQTAESRNSKPNWSGFKPTPSKRPPHAAELSAERSRAEANRSHTSRGGQLAALTWASSTIGVRHGD